MARLTQKQIDLIIAAKTQAGDALRQLKTQLNQIAQTANRTNAALERTQRTFQRSQKSIQSMTDSLRHSLPTIRATADSFARFSGMMAMRGTVAGAVGGLRTIEQSFLSTRNAVVTATLGLSEFAAVLGGIASATGIRSLLEATDTFKQTMAKVAIHTYDTNTQMAVFNSLVQQSANNWVPLKDAAFAFSRFTLSTKTLGLSFQDTLRFTDLLTKLVALSGSTAPEAHGALLQFSQALANNFQTAGQELNSVIEQMPALANALAEGLSKITKIEGITPANLKILATKGILNRETALQALSLMEDTIRERFSKIPKTIEAAMIGLRSSFTRFIGELDRATNASNKLISTIDYVAQNISYLSRIVMFIATAAVPLLVRVLAGPLISALTFAGRTMLTVFGASVFGKILSVLTLVVSYLVTFNDTTLTVFGRQVSVTALASEAWDRWGRRAWDAMTEAANAVKAWIQNLRGWLESALRAIDEFWTYVMDKARAVAEFLGFRMDPQIEKGPLMQGLKALRSELNDFLDDAQRLTELQAMNREEMGRKQSQALIAQLRKPLGTFQKPLEFDDKEAKKAADAFARSVESLINKVLPAIARQNEYNEALSIFEKLLKMSSAELAKFGLTAEVLPQMRANIEELMGAQSSLFNQTMRQLDEQIKLAQMGRFEREIEKDLMDKINEARLAGEPLLQKEIDLLREKMYLLKETEAIADAERQVTEQIENMLGKTMATMGLVSSEKEKALLLFETEMMLVRSGIRDYAKLEEILQRVATAYDANKQLLEQNKTAMLGAREALDDYITDATDKFVMGQQLMQSALKKTEDALFNFAKTGKLSFNDLVTSLLADITRLMSRQLLGSFLQLFMTPQGQGGSSGGGLFAGIGKLFAGKFHQGGTVEVGKASIPMPKLAFAGAPRYHSGGVVGLAQDEVPAILRRGEVVLTRSQYGSMIDARASRGAPVSVNMTVVTPDAGSFKKSRTQILADLGSEIQRATRRNR